MSQSLRSLLKTIKASVKGLTVTSTFSKWLREEAKPAEGDIVVINNSFIYRKSLKTTKNEQYLCLKVKGNIVNTEEIFVCEPGELNADFKLFSVKSANLPQLKPLRQALQEEMKRLGQLVFVLIGDLQEVPAEVPINHRLVKELRFDPLAAPRDSLRDLAGGSKAIVVSQLTDPEAAWDKIRPALAREVGDDLSSLETAYNAAFEELQKEARLKLVLPDPNAPKTTTSFIARLQESISDQRELYEKALQQCERGGGNADSHLREVMRIAYNFADDAIKVLQLLISIADLKAVLLWCTIKEHFDLAQAFRNLPWTKSDKKPSLERYREIINGARNRAFHNLLALDRTIEVDLAGVAVQARRLILFPPYGKRKTTVTFDYQDREIVEILSELTRAPEVAVPFDFWRKNAEVMRAFEKLLQSTERALWLLNNARKGK